MTIDLSDSSDSDQESCSDEFIYLKPNQIWEKPIYRTIILHNASISVRPEKINEARAVLQCTTPHSLVTLCTLLPNRPSQRLLIIWAPDQEANLVNTGNYPMTLLVVSNKMSF